MSQQMPASSLSSIMAEMLRTKSGRAGVAMLAALAAVSVAVLAVTPLDTLQEWNDPSVWLDLPKSAVPAWAGVLSPEGRASEHVVLQGNMAEGVQNGAMYVAGQGFSVDYHYDAFPSDIIYGYSAEYAGAPLLQLTVERPDGLTMMLYSDSLPYAGAGGEYSARVFSADPRAGSNLRMYGELFAFPTGNLPTESVVFSRTDAYAPLHGTYTFTASLYGAQHAAHITDSYLIVGGTAYGLLGTDDLRRDLAVGIAWGTPLALFIGVAVAAGSVSMGLFYGVYAGYRGRRTDETMMRLNDIVYALPALPFLIILAVTVSNSIFVMVLFLMAFGWVGVAKVSRSMSMQIRTQGYVEASRIMGRRDAGIIVRHVLPQLLPYAFASVAISVPAAITTEAGLSFLGLGDPSFPTWGHILHDASTYGAAARGMWWWIVPPGMMIAAAGLAFVFIGNALDRIANPRLRR